MLVIGTSDDVGNLIRVHVRVCQSADRNGILMTRG